MYNIILSPLYIYILIYIYMAQVNFYNINNALIETPKGPQYGGVSAWQGIRYLGSNIYLLCGTTNHNPNVGYGLIYVGEINCINWKFYY